MIGNAIASAAVAATMTTALVTTDAAVLRAAPRDSAPQQAQLWQGELLEVRGERLDYLQVWDHRRERGGYVKASQVKRTALAATEAPEILAVLRFVREAPGAEALGIGLAAAYLQAAPADAVRGAGGVEALDHLGTLADRLAQRASGQATLSKGAQAAVAGHLEVAARYGVKFVGYERESQVRLCYDGDAFRRVLALPASPAQKARAALALTQPECADPQLKAPERHQLNAWRAGVLEQVDSSALDATLKNRIHLRRAAVWSTVAYDQARAGSSPEAAAQRAVGELGAVQKAELAEDDVAHYNEAVMRVNASRWAGVAAANTPPSAGRPTVQLQAGQPGETCVLLTEGRAEPLARRCTYGLVWAQSATLNREGNALALAVQPLEGWRELWLFRRQGAQWVVDVLPPAPLSPELGYAEFAGWVPGGKEVLVAREARAEGRYRRSYDVVALDSLLTQRSAADPGVLGPFQRWADPSWKRLSVSLR